MSVSPESLPGSPVPDAEPDENPTAEDIPDAAVLSDDESVLSDVDEAEFEGFNPDNLAVDERPSLAIDEENLKLVGRHKRRREEGDEGERKKKKEGRREKKSRKKKDSDDGFSGGEEIDGKRTRKRKVAGERKDRARVRKEVEEENEEMLDPATSMICPSCLSGFERFGWICTDFLL